MNKKKLMKDKSLSDIVNENYHAADLLYKYEIDYYCHGYQSLSDACGKSGVGLEKVISELEALPNSERTKSEDVTKWSIPFLINFIENTHHKFVRDKNDKISRIAASISKNYKSDNPELESIYENFLLLIQEVDRHMNEEESRVFPLIKELAYEADEFGEPTLQTISVFNDEIERLKNEHEIAIQMLMELKKVSNNFEIPEHSSQSVIEFYQSLINFEKDLHRHIHLETNVLFKKAENLIHDN
ncbi:MAG: DUF542 domain-containing protein [Balneolaceae bacterium]